MRVTHVCFVGTRTEHYDETVSLFRDILGMPIGFEYPGWSGFKLSTGNRDFVEVFSTADRDERVFPHEAGSGPLVAFAVDDLTSARDELVAAGVELLGDIVWADVLFENPASAGFGWCFFKGPDGNVYVLQQDAANAPKAPSA
jgi:catechol 2,3-dioxygenase-like lactoylglutathione lyase family enzyme